MSIFLLDQPASEYFQLQIIICTKYNNTLLLGFAPSQLKTIDPLWATGLLTIFPHCFLQGLQLVSEKGSKTCGFTSKKDMYFVQLHPTANILDRKK